MYLPQLNHTVERQTVLQIAVRMYTVLTMFESAFLKPNPVPPSPQTLASFTPTPTKQPQASQAAASSSSSSTELLTPRKYDASLGGDTRLRKGKVKPRKGRAKNGAPSLDQSFQPVSVLHCAREAELTGDVRKEEERIKFWEGEHGGTHRTH